MSAEKFHKQLLASDQFAQYSLRASFFFSRLRGLRLYEAIQDVHQLAKAPNSFAWRDFKKLGIEQEAWDRVAAKGINPLLIFCHPRVLSDQPYLLTYYRTVSLVSQKGLTVLVHGNIAAVEAGKVARPDPAWLQRVVITLNSLVSSMLKTAADIDVAYLPGLQFASAGATIQGSWNTSIGAAAEVAIKAVLINNLRQEILQVVFRGRPAVDYAPALHAEVIDRIADVQLVRMKRGFHLVFSSEPDVSLRDADNRPLLAIEIKAGADPAGALERLGAAMKSFENDKNLNPQVKTVYVVRCMTPELEKRIRQSSPFDYTFGLSELLLAGKSQTTFSNLVLRTMLGK